MTDLPIIFSAPMVRALIDGRKTMTRRLAWRDSPAFRKLGERPSNARSATTWQSVRPGDRLWVRENIGRRVAITLLGEPAKNGVEEAFYAADGEDVLNEHSFNLCPWWPQKGTLPSIHMPRWASRLTLIVTSTKIERLQDISEADARAEGVMQVPVGRAYEHFALVWTDLHGSDAWGLNPEVVALTFTVHKQNIDALPKAVAA